MKTRFPRPFDEASFLLKLALYMAAAGVSMWFLPTVLAKAFVAFG